MNSKRASVVSILRATALFTVTSLLIAPGAHAADVAVKAKKPDDAPFFFVNDNRLTFAYQFTGTAPGNPGTTAKQVYAFTHFDAWTYGRNLINIDLLKSDLRDPAECVDNGERFMVLDATMHIARLSPTEAGRMYRAVASEAMYL